MVAEESSAREYVRFETPHHNFDQVPTALVEKRTPLAKAGGVPLKAPNIAQLNE
jgi:hypothetical protein